MSAQSEALVAFQHIKLLDSCEFLFHPSPQQHLTLYSHLLDDTNIKILVYNNVDHVIKISMPYQLGSVIELSYKSCFATSTNLNTAFTPHTLPIIFHDHNNISIPLVRDLEMELPNGIKIYGDKETVDTITCLVNKYPSIWKSLRFVQVPPKCWIKVYLKPGWETKISIIKPRVYLLDIKAKDLVNKMFDKMQSFGRLKYITSHTLFSFWIFVVYKIIIKGEKKRRAIVNIRKLNNLVISDAYPLSLQSDIITSV